MFPTVPTVKISSVVPPPLQHPYVCVLLQIFLDVPLEEVQRRDPKGLYKQVEEGKLKGFTGVDAPYEPPLNAGMSLLGVCILSAGTLFCRCKLVVSREWAAVLLSLIRC